MSLTLPLEELYRLRVSAKISSKDGRIALTLKPEPSNPGLTQDHPSGLSVHFETAQEDGGSALSIFTSYEAPLALAAPQKNGQKDTGADSSCLPSGDFQDNHISSDSNIPLENYPSSHETRDLETGVSTLLYITT
jgi:hypothetical protein